MISEKIKSELVQYRECYLTSTEAFENIKKHLSQKLPPIEVPKPKPSYIYFEEDLKGGHTKLIVTLLIIVGFFLVTFVCSLEPCQTVQAGSIAQIHKYSGLQIKSALGMLTVLLPVFGFLSVIVYGNRLR
jgi:hypothetical protein